MLGFVPIDGPRPSAAARPTQLRPLDATAASLLAEAPLRSPTIARLLERLERSDVVTQIEAPRYLSRSLSGVTRLMTASDSLRYVRITLSRQKSREETIAVLGHELQHAVEIAGAPDVRTQKQMREFYRRTGFHNSSRKGFETVAAIETMRAVRSEVYDVERTRMARRTM
jgi:hypothetical protein